MEKTIDFTPTLCKGKGAQFQGTITLTVPSFNDSYEYIESLEGDLKLGEDGSTVNDVDIFSNVKVIRKMVGLSEKHYKEVKIAAKDGSAYSCFEDLSFDRTTHPILTEVAQFIVFGQQPGKN